MLASDLEMGGRALLESNNTVCSKHGPALKVSLSFPLKLRSFLNCEMSGGGTENFQGSETTLDGTMVGILHNCPFKGVTTKREFPSEL